MKKQLLNLLFTMCLSQVCFSQINLKSKFEIAVHTFIHHSVMVEANAGWKGYNIEQNGIELNYTKSVVLNNQHTIGLGLALLNYGGYKGLNIFSDFEYYPQKRRVNTLANFKIGYNHIWNQYDGGKGTLLGEFLTGLNYIHNDKYSSYIKSGLLFTQQSLFIPIRIGFTF